jgi:peptidoglycan-N-acetylglucosamine deacetylase
MALLVGSCGIAVLLSGQQLNNQVITAKNNKQLKQEEVNKLIGIKTASADIVNSNFKQVVPKQFEGTIIYNGKIKEGKSKENKTTENKTTENQHKNAKKLVALTFDDGPSPKYTSKVLKILKINNAKGTFFGWVKWWNRIHQ